MFQISRHDVTSRYVSKFQVAANRFLLCVNVSSRTKAMQCIILNFSYYKLLKKTIIHLCDIIVLILVVFVAFHVIAVDE